MIPMPIATPPEPEARSVRGRTPDRSMTGAEGFESAFQSLSRKDAKSAEPVAETADGADTRKEATSEEETATLEETATVDGAAEADPRLSLLTLLSPPDRDAPQREGSAGKASRVAGSVADRIEGADGIETKPEEQRAAMRIAVVRRETHFEPTVHTPIESGEKPAASTTNAQAQAAAMDLSQLLDARVARATETAVGATRNFEAGQVAAADLGNLGAKGHAANERVMAASANGKTEDAAEDISVEADGAAALGDEPRRDRRADLMAANASVSRLSSGLRETEQQPGASLSTSGPSTMPNVATQVASTVIEAFPDALRPAAPESPRSGSAFAPTEGGLRLRAGGAALKTLTIQLQPEHLGTLDVTMRLTDGRLTLELAADKVETARLLTADRAGLRSLLEQAGFSIEDAAISVVAREAIGATNARASEQASTQGDRSGADGRRDAQPEAGSGNRGDGGGNGGNRRAAQREIAERAPATGSVFL